MMQISFGNVFSKSNLIKIYTSFLLSLTASISMEIAPEVSILDDSALFQTFAYPYDTNQRKPTCFDGDLSFVELTDEALWDEHDWFFERLDYNLLSPFFKSIELGKDENGNHCSRAFHEYYVFHSREVTMSDFKLPCLTKLEQIDANYKITNLTQEYKTRTPTCFHDHIQFYFVHPESLCEIDNTANIFFVWIEAYNPKKEITFPDKMLINRMQTNTLKSVEKLLNKEKIHSLYAPNKPRVKRNLNINIEGLQNPLLENPEIMTPKREDISTPKTLRRTRTKSGTKDPSPRIIISSLTRSAEPSPLTSRKLEEPRDSAESPKRVQIKSSSPRDGLIDSDGTGSAGQTSDNSSRRRRSSSSLRHSNHKLNSGSRGGSPRDEISRSLASSLESSPRSPSPRDDIALMKTSSGSLDSSASSSREGINYTLKVILSSSQVNTTTIDCSNMPSHYNMTIVPEIKETESKDLS